MQISLQIARARSGEGLFMKGRDGPRCGGGGVGPHRTLDPSRARPEQAEAEQGCAGDCPPVCMPREEVCYTPPLPAGTWRVQVDGLEAPETTIVVGSVAAPGTVCTPEP